MVIYVTRRTTASCDREVDKDIIRLDVLFLSLSRGGEGRGATRSKYIPSCTTSHLFRSFQHPHSESPSLLYPRLLCFVLRLSLLFSAFNAIAYALSTLRSFYSSTCARATATQTFFLPPKYPHNHAPFASSLGTRQATVFVIRP